MCVRVVNVKGLRTREGRAAVTYVGRAFAGWKGHALGNPFRRATMAHRHLLDALDRYRAWLLARPTLDADLAALWEQCDRGAKPLGCWCTDAAAGDGSEVVCHAQVLAELLRERFCTEAKR